MSLTDIAAAPVTVPATLAGLAVWGCLRVGLELAYATHDTPEADPT